MIIRILAFLVWALIIIGLYFGTRKILKEINKQDKEIDKIKFKQVIEEKLEEVKSVEEDFEKINSIDKEKVKKMKNKINEVLEI